MLTFVFGDKSVAQIEKSDVSKKLVEELLNAGKYAEGRGLSVKITKKNDLKDIYELINIKIRN